MRRWQGPEQDEETSGQEQQFGGPRGSAGQWASCVRIVDPATAGLCALPHLLPPALRRLHAFSEKREASLHT